MKSIFFVICVILFPLVAHSGDIIINANSILLTTQSFDGGTLSYLCSSQSFNLKLQFLTRSTISCSSPTLSYFLFESVLYNINTIHAGTQYWTNDLIQQGLFTFRDISGVWSFISNSTGHSVSFFQGNNARFDMNVVRGVSYEYRPTDTTFNFIILLDRSLYLGATSVQTIGTGNYQLVGPPKLPLSLPVLE